jgi:uncharacterized protein YndB with AHSA1/START domain
VNETLQIVDGRNVFRTERRLAHPPEKVWRAVTEPPHVDQWFPASVSYEPEVGSKITFDMGGDEGPTPDGVVTGWDPPRVFAFTWGPDLLHWEIRPDGAGSLLILTHTFADRYGAPSFAAGWQVCLDGLDQVLAGEPVSQARPAAALHESYVERFGLAEGTAESTEDGWQVRFERQLTLPGDRVWALLTGGATPRAGETPPAGVTVPDVPAERLTEVDPPRLLAYEWLAGDRVAGQVRWELRQGTGYGARLVLTQTGPADLDREPTTARTAWKGATGRLASRIAAEADAGAGAGTAS